MAQSMGSIGPSHQHHTLPVKTSSTGSFLEGRNDKLNANNLPITQKISPSATPANDLWLLCFRSNQERQLFFWWNEEWNKDNRGNLVTTCVPTKPNVEAISVLTWRRYSSVE